MIQRGEVIPLPAVTKTYVLYRIGERADEEPFTKYKDDVEESPALTDESGSEKSQNKKLAIELYSEAQLGDAYQSLEEKRTRLEKEIASLQSQSIALKKSDREKQKELQKEISAKQHQLNSTAETKARLDKFYGQPDSRQPLLRDYDTLQNVAKNLGGRSYDLALPADRQALKVHMLSSLRPEALKILEEVASAYHSRFDRPLPVSSLVRPEQYQHELRKVNRNAVLIETPPHSTGLAFDIDYRYMSGAEQAFVMAELARLKKEGRIEVIRERNANYHVFAFINGARPSDDLIAASREAAGAPSEEEDNEVDEKKPEEPANLKSKRPTAKGKTVKSKARRISRRR